MKKVFFFLALMSATMLSAKQYCGETITSNNGHKATITCQWLGEDQYEFVFESEDAITGYNAGGSNFFANVNGTGGYQVSNNMVQKGNTLTCTMTSTSAPTIYAGVFFVNFSDGEAQFTIPTDADFSQACGTVELTSISLDKTEMELLVNRKGTLKVTFEPANASNRNVSWATDNAEVATVDNGVVKAIAEGTATITATSEEGGKTASCVVTVTANEGEVTLEKDGHIVFLTAYIVEKNTYELTISSDEVIAWISGGVYWHVNGEDVEQLLTKQVASEDPHTIVIRTESTSVPQIYTPLYLGMPGEVNFGDITLNWIDKTTTSSVDATSNAASVRKSIINGQLILTIDGINYTAQGQMVK